MDYMQFKCLRMKIVTPKDISDGEVDDEGYHIYMIASKPQLHFVGKEGDSLIVDAEGENISYELKPNSPEYDSIRTEISKNGLSVKVECIKDNAVGLAGTVEAKRAYIEWSDHQEYRIDYIGKSFGDNGEKTSIGRLRSHSTLQKILSENEDAIEKRDIFIILLDIAPLVMYSVNSPEDIKLGEFPDNQRSYTSLIEAKLINFFKPKYNKTFSKGSVPSLNHDSYNELLKKSYYGYEIAISLMEERKRTYRLFTDSKSVTFSNNHATLLIREQFENSTESKS